LGYGQVLGIELPGEQDGLIPDPDWKRINVGENWSTGDTYIATIGQGYVLATPLQVLVSMATIANDGKLMKPTIVREVLDSEGNVVKSFEPKMLWDITQDPVIHVYDENFLQTGEMKTVAPWVVKKVQEGLREVVVSGTASTIFDGFPIPSAGKTGTAEYCDNVAQEKNLCQPGNWPAHAWYVGYAPYDNPEIAVVAFVYNGDEGARLAAPVVRRVMEAYFNLKEVDTEAIGSSLP
ncbi:MAG: penicillin-binding transpeptidase domain-containing protein, partial [Thermanaerothrix sp.]|nr:penicillin-binding transpeptidase domain-containing protein [Thermanaerothrix sp.]